MTRDEQGLQKAKKMGGYDRRLTLKYIEDLRNEYEKKLTEEQLKTDALKEQLSDLQQEQASLSEQNKLISENVYKEQYYVGELNLSINKLNIELSSQRVELNEKEKQNYRLSAELEILKKENEELRIIENQYEELRTRFSDMMLEVRTNADKLMANANRQAAETVADAKKRAEELVEGAHRYVNEVNSDISTLRAQVVVGRKYLSELSEGIISGLNNIELVANSMDYTANRDEDYEIELSMLSDIITQSKNKVSYEDKDEQQ